jgi:broad specificity phosphatase PhoE
MAALVHLVRHAEVDNPDHLVCGSTPGFDLSPHGLEQARRVGRYLGPRAVVAIWSSPQQRALRTAEEIAARSAVPVRVHPDLTDWSLMDRWKGHAWNSISRAFPGELEAYLEHPTELDFVDEPLTAVADRVAAVARELDAEHPHGDVIVVSHQDAIQAGRIQLTGGDLSTLHDGPPASGAVISLRPGPAWKEETFWQPGDSPRFGEKSDLRVVPAGSDPSEPSPA